MNEEKLNSLSFQIEQSKYFNYIEYYRLQNYSENRIQNIINELDNFLLSLKKNPSHCELDLISRYNYDSSLRGIFVDGNVYFWNNKSHHNAIILMKNFEIIDDTYPIYEIELNKSDDEKEIILFARNTEELNVVLNSEYFKNKISKGVLRPNMKNDEEFSIYDIAALKELLSYHNKFERMNISYSNEILNIVFYFNDSIQNFDNMLNYLPESFLGKNINYRIYHHFKDYFYKNKKWELFSAK